MADDRDMIDALQRELNSLGRLFAETNNEVKHLFKHAEEERQRSSEYRKDMRQEVHALRMEQAHSNLQMVGLKQDVGEVKTDVSELSAKVGTIEATRQQGIGVWNAAKVLWTVALGLGAAGIGAIVHAFWPPK
jgi:chromosome segregation ATPase